MLNDQKSKFLWLFVLCLGLLVSLPIQMQAQNGSQKQRITGVVKDASGESVIGATVAEKGTSNGTVTDLDGHFALMVNHGATLQISFVGYKTSTVSTAGKNEVSVVLQEDSKVLNDVVVVGYGTQKKSDVTGSVTSVNKDRLSKLPVEVS
jgi:hypothetical protein